MLRVIGFVILVLLSPDTCLLAAESIVANGIVFEDLNGNSIRDADEPGIGGVRVSNGREIVVSDASGRYSIKIDADDAILFLIKPRDWMTPVNDLQIPQFFYIHKPAGSGSLKFSGVDPTGPLPDSVDFPLTKQLEPDKFRALLFGDPQPRDIREVEYIAHDVIEQVIAEKAHSASFGVTLGDIVFDDLAIFRPLNQAIALIGIPWYNVIGNHDINLDAHSDEESDETFESHYGPAYYSFEYGPTHFIVLDDVMWVPKQGDKAAHYFGGLGERQMQFIANDLALIPESQLVVLLMHIPLVEVEDRHDLYRMIEQRPAALSISAHKHYMEHQFIGSEDGWHGPVRHHHIINVTVCGSWFNGQPDERGIPHATMSDGGPNGYSIIEFDGTKYALEFRAASRPSDYQMNIYAPEMVSTKDLTSTTVLANVFVASENTKCEMRIGDQGDWLLMERITINDPAFMAEKQREEQLVGHPWRNLPAPHPTPHIFRAMLPPDLLPGTYNIEVKASDPISKEVKSNRIIRVESGTLNQSTEQRAN
ncbi:MAG: calcineurin-like phosphoesterase family protein [Planctomycetales bacterium]|nr:calcineurin-like phosphoesterase family protein [Planctomycetales bacterium]